MYFQSEALQRKILICSKKKQLKKLRNSSINHVQLNKSTNFFVMKNELANNVYTLLYSHIKVSGELAFHSRVKLIQCDIF